MKILEMTKTIMGESRYQGYLCTLLRLARCNLNCFWCDTLNKNEEGIEYTIEELVKGIEKRNLPHLLITGGEPLLQLYKIHELIKILVDLHLSHKKAPYITIETNGTIQIPGFMRALWGDFVTVVMDIKTPSSGMMKLIDWEATNTLLRRDEIKFVVDTEVDLKFVEQVVPQLSFSTQTIIISPTPRDGWKKTVAKWLIQNEFNFKLQVQLHKILGIV